MAGFDVNDTVLILQLAGDEQEARAGDNNAIPLEDVGRDDDVGDAGLVFEGEEDEAFGGAGALSGDDSARGADELIGARRFELGSGEDAEVAKVLTLIGHGVRACGEAGAGVVSGEPLVGGHFAKGVGCCVSGCGAAQKRTDGAAGLLDLPESIAAMRNVAKRVERADLSEDDKFRAIERRDAGGEFINRVERAVEIASGEDRFGRSLAEAFDVVEADAESGAREASLRG